MPIGSRGKCWRHDIVRSPSSDDDLTAANCRDYGITRCKQTFPERARASDSDQ